MPKRKEYKENNNLLLIKPFVECSNKVAAHKIEIIKNTIPMSNIDEWNTFKDEITALSKEYFDLYEQIKEVAIDKNYKYLECIMSIITKIEEKYEGRMNEINFLKLQKQIRIICVFNEYTYSLEKIDSQKYLAKRYNNDLSKEQNVEGKIFFVPENLKKEFAYIVDQQTKLYPKYKQANEYVFGGPTLENNSKTM